MRIARHTTRLAASATMLAAALSLTACENGTKDTGSQAPAASSAPETGGQSAPSSADAKGRTQDGHSSKAGPGATAGSGPHGTNGSGQATGQGSGSHSATVACTNARVKVTAIKINHPVNHMLLTATNTGSVPCYAYNAPYLRWDEGQAATAFLERSKPQAVITLAPGQSAYAGIMYRSADGSGSGGHTARSLGVLFANRAGNGSTGPSVRFTLPKGGITTDSSAWVTYWQTSAQDALTW
ncbi:DUF4232 domain-containing protein [Streptomyces lydicus]|uniref:DUF4232 domain-containing protein n=1 Tax=Streptomyces lydicus TaxID=47763 RepID=UPI0036FE1998